MSKPNTPNTQIDSPDAKQVALFITCLVDVFRPNVGFAAIKLLQACDYEVVIPKAQTCCGQPAYNSGDITNARTIAQQVIDTFSRYQTVVVPSGSCAGMIVKHYPSLFEEGSHSFAQAQALAQKTVELTAFLASQPQASKCASPFEGKIWYHHGCAGLRELGIDEQPLSLLQAIPGVNLVPSRNHTECCGFGGLFCVKFDEVSNKMAEDKLAAIADSGADVLTSTDLGCLLQLAGKLTRQGSPIKVWHTAEILAGLTDGSAFGELNTKHDER